MNRKPNVVFVLTDDQGYGDLGCTGNPWVKTPNIDAFHGDAVSMSNYHVGPTCAPTRSGLMTGHYANSTGVWHTIGGRSLLRKDEWTLASALKENGYATGIFGKWHLGDTKPYRPEDRGFDEVVVHGGGGISQTPDYWGNDYFDDTYRKNGEYRKFEGYCTDVFFSEALQFIERASSQKRPFFCYIATNAPHAPYNVEDRYADLYRGAVMEPRARFYGMITNIDENFGNLVRHLDRLGLTEDTILVFMTDNGSSEALTYDGRGNVVEGYNMGLRGLKNSEYDGGHRVPFFLRYPATGIGGGKRVDTLCANIDFMPTILDYCGVDPGEHTFHGQSLRDVLEGNGQRFADRIIVTDSQREPRPKKWKKCAVMKGEYRLVNGTELYDLDADFGQRHDIAARNPGLVEELRAAYEQWWDLVSARFDEPIPLYLEKRNVLTAHDWRGIDDQCVWNQSLVRSARIATCHWEVKVPRSGRYVIRLYRWPPETGYPIRAGIEGDDSHFERKFVEERFWDYYENGKKLEIVKAYLIVDDEIVATAAVTDGMRFVQFEVLLDESTETLEGRFETMDGTLLGSYYATVE
jgi:arylsulfatase A-like enzyme